MDPLSLFIAFGPIAVYLAIIGTINLLGKPLVATGSRDIAALGVSMSGLMIVGPMQLFMPYDAANRFGPYVWLVLLGFYLLCLSLVVLLMRPRLVIYNISTETMRPTLVDVVTKIDKDARWAGDSLTIPQLGIQLHLEISPFSHVVQLVSSGTRQDYNGWRELESQLLMALRQQKRRINPIGYGMLAMACAIGLSIGLLVTLQPDAVQQAWNNYMFR